MAFHRCLETVEIVLEKEPFQELPARIIADPAIPRAHYKEKCQQSPEETSVAEPTQLA